MANKPAPYDTDNLKSNKGGFTKERQLAGEYKAGLYKHPDAKDAAGNPVEIATKFDPLYGDVQSEAVARLGFQRVGDVPEGYSKETAPDFASAGKESGTLKGIQARLDALEAENAQLRAERDAKAGAASDSPKSLDKMNQTELRAAAETEGVDVEGLNSNKELAAAIQKARDEKESE